MAGDKDPFKLEDLVAPPEAKSMSGKGQRRRGPFIKFPLTWEAALEGASRHTYALALRLLHLWWQHKGPFPLSNGKLGERGISRFAKWRALVELKRRGLVSVERRPRRSPIISLLQTE
jgi:hypothetical protein